MIDNESGAQLEQASGDRRSLVYLPAKLTAGMCAALTIIEQGQHMAGFETASQQTGYVAVATAVGAVAATAFGAIYNHIRG